MASKFKKRNVEKRGYKRKGVLKINFDLIKLKIKQILQNINYGKS